MDMNKLSAFEQVALAQLLPEEPMVVFRQHDQNGMLVVVNLVVG
jgi:hypothetical protein